jgi:hypothetical protein
MDDFPVFTVADLSGFSGRVESSYNVAFAGTALTQAVLLFNIASCLRDWPDDPVFQDLAKMGVLAYADYIVLSQPYQGATASPFNSESLGSYSYSKSVAAASRGEATGVMWFDLAVSRLGVCDIANGVPEFGGLEVFEHDADFVPGSFEGTARMLSAADRALLAEFLDAPTVTRN